MDILKQLAPLDGKKVIVGMSGGVDSSLTAALLKEAGARVQGAFMHNFEDDSHDCPAVRDWSDAQQVAELLQINIDYVNLAADYDSAVFQPFLAAIQNGLTPNPDILCNEFVKFGSFMDYADECDADYVATGHYARIVCGRLHAARSRKDQSYFLARVRKDAWQRVIFPLGDFAGKQQVRDQAARLNIPVHAKRDSQGICFVANSKFPTFLRRYLAGMPGDIVDTDGKVLGEHPGLIFFTLGQRKALGIGGVKGAREKPWYVVSRDWNNHKLIVSQDKKHPSLASTGIFVDDLQLDLPDTSAPLSVRIRHRGPLHPCSLDVLQMRVSTATPMWAPAPGQMAVFYQRDAVVGSGVIGALRTQ